MQPSAGHNHSSQQRGNQIWACLGNQCCGCFLAIPPTPAFATLTFVVVVGSVKKENGWGNYRKHEHEKALHCWRDLADFPSHRLSGGRSDRWVFQGQTFSRRLLSFPPPPLSFSTCFWLSAVVEILCYCIPVWACSYELISPAIVVKQSSRHGLLCAHCTLVAARKVGRGGESLRVCLCLAAVKALLQEKEWKGEPLSMATSVVQESFGLQSWFPSALTSVSFHFSPAFFPFGSAPWRRLIFLN